MFNIIKEANTTENHQQVPSNDQQAPTGNAPDACSQKKGTSQRRIEANRRNALRSTGPGNTQRTRHNAIRHGLLAEGLTQWDNAEEYQENIHALTAIYPSSDPVVTFLIEQWRWRCSGLAVPLGLRRKPLPYCPAGQIRRGTRIGALR
jgi:hypothetical protein